jgi:hypothetical protein
VAIHPALVPYTAALMTEGVTAGLLAIAVALALGGERPATRRIVAAGVVMGLATLVRPQCLLLAPALGWIAALPLASTDRWKSAALVTAIAIACCLPWTARNCARMNRCALVSVNGGWNLLIGAQTENGAWHEPLVPEECRTVWDEAAKDLCFERAARALVARSPGAWIARVPDKIGVTLDYFGAAPWYLATSNPAAFTERDKVVLGSVETVFSRLLLVAALVTAARLEGPRSRARTALAAAGTLASLLVHAWLGYLALSAAAFLLGARAPKAALWTGAVVALTALTHAVFFGAGRYGLVVAPFVAVVAFLNGRVRFGNEPRSPGG